MVNSNDFDPLSSAFDPLSSVMPGISSGNASQITLSEHDRLYEIKINEARDKAILKPAPPVDSERFAELKNTGKIGIYNKKENTVKGTEKVEILAILAKGGKIDIEDSSGKRRRIDLSKATFTVLSDSEYHAQISALAQKILEKKGLEQKEKTEKNKTRENKWYQNAIDTDRIRVDVKESSKKYEIIYRRIVSTIIKFQEMSNQRNRDIRKKEKDKEDFSRELSDTKERISERKEENRKEDVKIKLGLPPKKMSIKDIEKARRKKEM